MQFYETDDYLLQTLADYVAGAFAAGDAAIVVATAAHRSALDERLAGRGIDIASPSTDPSARPASRTSSAR